MGRVFEFEVDGKIRGPRTLRRDKYGVTAGSDVGLKRRAVRRWA